MEFHVNSLNSRWRCLSAYFVQSSPAAAWELLFETILNADVPADGWEPCCEGWEGVACDAAGITGMVVAPVGARGEGVQDEGASSETVGGALVRMGRRVCEGAGRAAPPAVRG